MELFKLFGTIAIDNAEANEALDDTGDKAKETGKNIKETGDDADESSSKMGAFFTGAANFAVKAGKIIAVGLGAASAAVVKIGKDAISAYGDYEQLVGGVETLFKDSSDTVIQNAANAYKTAGMSANAYMETVTSFSASLLQSLGGDTVKAAEKADTAITDMSDNANKMGTSMEAIQNAYQGFAKQNYTMLDNLKLGYGGTKEEMERLLEDASKISGIKYDISSFSDITDAIHIVQTEMGITGTTAKEAATTIQGSISSMKGAWQNLLTGLTDGNQNIGQLTGNLFNSLITVADNLIPRISQVLDGIANVISDLAPKLLGKVSELIDRLLPGVVNGAVTLINALVSVLPSLMDTLIDVLPSLIDGLGKIVDGLIAAAPDILTALMEGLVILLADGLPKLIEGIINLITTVFSNVGQIIQPLIDRLPEIIINIVNALMNNLPTLIQGLITLVISIVEALPEIILALIEAIPTVITSILEGLWNSLPVLLEGIISIVGSILSAIWEVLSTIFAPLGDFFAKIWNALTAAFSTVGNWVYEHIIAPVANFFKGLWEGIVSAFHTVIDPWIEIVKRASVWVNDNIIKPVKEFFSKLWNDIVGIFKGAASWFNNTVIQPIANVFSKIWNTIKDGASKAWEGIKNVFKPVADWFKNIFSKAWQAVKNVFSTGGKIFDGIKDGIVKAFKTVVNAIIKGINKVISIPFNAINAVLSKIHGISILGVSPFSWVHTFNVPQIPLLAEGTVVDKGARPAIIGEDGAEAVVPLEKHTGWIKNVARQLHEFSLETTANISDVLPEKLMTSEDHQAIREQADGITSLNEKFAILLNAVAEFYPKVLDKIPEEIVMDADSVSKGLAPAMDKALGKIYVGKNRGLAY